MAEPAKTRKFELAKSFGIIIEPFNLYWQGLSKTNNPDQFAAYIRSLRTLPAEFTKLAIAALCVSTVIAKVLGYSDGAFSFFNIPVIDELLVIFYIFIIGYLSAFLVHKPLLYLGGKADFHHTLNACIYLQLILFPLVIAADGFSIQLLGSPIKDIYWSGVTVGYLSVILSKIHEIPVWKGFLVLYSIAILIPLAVSALVIVA